MPRHSRRSRLGGSRGVPVLVPVRASPVRSVGRGSSLVKFSSLPPCRLRAKSKTRNATLTSQSGVLSQQPRSMVLEQRSSSLNPTLHNTEQRLPNKTPLCKLQSGLLLRKTPTKHVRAESSQCNTAQHSGSGQFPRRGCFRLPQSRSPSLLLFRAGLC